MVFDGNRHNDSHGSIFSQQSAASAQTVKVQKSNPLVNIPKKNEDPVVKMLKPPVSGGANLFNSQMNQSILRKSSVPKRQGPQLSEE